MAKRWFLGRSVIEPVFIGSFGVSFPSDPIADVNADGIVDDMDLEIFSRDFGRNECPEF